MTANSRTDRAMVEDLITEREGVRPARVRHRRTVLRGGLEAVSLDRIVAQYLDSAGRPSTFAVVVKRLKGTTVREAAVYQGLVGPYAADLAPRLYAANDLGSDEAALYIEALDPVSSWPWTDRRAAQSVLETAGSLHNRAFAAEAVARVAAWDYEAELQRSAELTLELLERLRRQPALWTFGGALRWTRRVVSALPRLRRQLLMSAPFGSTIIHGDLHSGNVVFREVGSSTVPVLIDWARTRIGSPLEDVSSWLQSLGAWEPEARRRHDTLFTGYLASRGLEPRLTPEIRAAYWLAGGANALAGALAYYVSLLMDPLIPSAGRAGAATLVREWVRVLRRADAFWS